ncbi:hypothetical protein BHE74_00030113 [Ensete ventricosum]|nr:hypothetical protein GW17_00007758 [Ensete ventricosum]RWW62745.1 hypothetical protein BHE74_00030113 [Ensete ventricosum]
MASRKIPSPAPPPSPRGPQLPRTTNSLASPCRAPATPPLCARNFISASTRNEQLSTPSSNKGGTLHLRMLLETRLGLYWAHDGTLKKETDVHSKATSPRTLEPYKVAQDLLQQTHSPAQAVKPRPTMAKAATTNSFSHPSDRAKTRYSGREATMTDSFSHPSGRAKTRYSGSRYGGLILLPKRSSQDLL